MGNSRQIKLAAPLFILREEAARDLMGVLEKLAGLGFEGVELLGFFGRDPGEIRSKLDALGMKALGNHVPLGEFWAEPEAVLERHQALGCSYLTIGWPDRALQPGAPGLKEAVERLGALSRMCRDKGITPLYHNHDFEFRSEPPLMDLLLDSCREDGLQTEPDLGWMVYSQVDPAYYLEKYRDRCPVIHWKDVYASDFSKVGDSALLGEGRGGSAKGHFEFRPVGYGVINAPMLMPLCLECNPEWMVMDHDLAYGRDSYGDLKLSLEYIRALLDIHTQGLE